MDDFQKRIAYQEDITPILKAVCLDYSIGSYQSHSIIPVGYEDLNLILQTTIGKYFVKIFASYRSFENCQRYINITSKAIEFGVSHPKLFKVGNNCLYSTNINGININLCVEEYINGQSFYDSNLKPTKEDIASITDEVAKINLIDFHPEYISDNWAVENMITQYKKIEKLIINKDRELLSPIIAEYLKTDFDKLPHALVHGDLIKTNILKDKENKIFFIDFSVANYYPRIQELAILFCNIFFNEDDPSSSNAMYKEVLSRYQKTLPLKPLELELLPTYIKFAHAMHIIGASCEKYLFNNDSQENTYWLELGRKGLKNS